STKPTKSHELWNIFIFLLQSNLIMMSRNRFVKKERFHTTGKVELRRIGKRNIENTGSFSIRCSLDVFCTCTCFPKFFGLTDFKNRLRKDTERGARFRLYLLHNFVESVKDFFIGAITHGFRIGFQMSQEYFQSTLKS